MKKRFTGLTVFVFLFATAIAQKGEKVLSAGLLLAPSDGSTPYRGYYYSWGIGRGVEVTGEANISEKSALLAQFQLTYFRGSSSFTSLLYRPTVTPVSLKGGYRYRFAGTGFFANASSGLEYADKDLHLPLAVGIGKRFATKGERVIDAGIDYSTGFVSRFNIKAVISMIRKT